jgi:TFIIF-interacting CTD phosphatase-like protein
MRSSCPSCAQEGREAYYTHDGVRTAFERRPHLREFLEAAAVLFELVVFTAGSQAMPHAAHALGAALC